MTGEIKMGTAALDLQHLLPGAEGNGCRGFPQRGSIGHVHLRVGDTETADRFSAMC
jgi:catechol 2,3-dioxygenase